MTYLLIALPILVLPLLMIGLGIAALRKPDLMWKWQQNLNQRRGVVTSKRSDAWARDMRQRGMIVLCLGVGAGIFLAIYMLNLFASPFS